MFFNSFWSLVPAIVAIALALITKEVYSSLFIGILAGGLMYSGFSLTGTMEHVFVDGMIGSLTDSWNIGIIIFLVILGAMVMLMNRAGGSAAFGRWATAHVKTKVGAQLATIALGVLIFVDDYFNCLTVGSVMSPLAETHGISRAKLAYLIDATAAPVCIIAPVSSWAAAVSSYVSEGNGLSLFIKAEGVPAEVFSSTRVEPMCKYYVRDEAVEVMKNGGVAIIAGGTGNPFFTTDSAAALRACEIGADALLKGTKVDGVYDSDPMKNPDARKYHTLTFEKALADNLKVMDATAFTLCRENDIPIVVFKMEDEGTLEGIVAGKDLGTVVSNG